MNMLVMVMFGLITSVWLVTTKAVQIDGSRIQLNQQRLDRVLKEEAEAEAKYRLRKKLSKVIYGSENEVSRLYAIPIKTANNIHSNIGNKVKNIIEHSNNSKDIILSNRISSVDLKNSSKSLDIKRIRNKYSKIIANSSRNHINQINEIANQVSESLYNNHRSRVAMVNDFHMMNNSKHQDYTNRVSNTDRHNSMAFIEQETVSHTDLIENGRNMTNSARENIANEVNKFNRVREDMTNSARENIANEVNKFNRVREDMTNSARENIANEFNKFNRVREDIVNETDRVERNRENVFNEARASF